MQTIGVEGQPEQPGWRSRLALMGILLGTVLIRLIRLDQPIAENYVGRQVPTAMVARNLERGSGFFRPRLDTAPFPNYFVVEPPVYELAVVGLRRLAGFRIEACGRILSAVATALGAWGLFGLIRRHEAERTACAAAIAFSLLPINLRYGRAFQPDALMLGTVLGGMNCWDCAEGGRGRWWLLPGWFLLAIGLAAKITAAFVLIPLGVAIIRPRKAADMLIAASALVPVLLWYLWANHLVESGGGSRASAENRAIWLAVLGFSALGNRETLTHLWRFLLIRGFTPLGLAVSAWGLCLRQRGQEAFRPHPPTKRGQESFDVWRVWGLAALLMMALLADKLHHEYYWLSLAPVVAAGLGRAWARLVEWRRGLAWALGLVLLVSTVFLSRSTWETPPEWKDLETAARRVQVAVPSADWLVAPEPLLFQADRRGCRLEFTARSAVRAAAEWPQAGATQIEGPLDLIDFHRTQGARFVADVGPDPGDDRRKALHEAIRRRYKVLVDCKSVIIAELNPSEIPGHGQ